MTRRVTTGFFLGLLSVLVLYVFLPTLAQGWAPLDDGINFLRNPSFRGFSPEHLRWMWTTRLAGHFIPLSWMSLAGDFTLSGMDPRGYHRTNLLLHLANALLLFAFARRLFRIVGGEVAEGSGSAHSRELAAFAAAAFFALHPLRVESVAWITERRDVLCGLFCLLTLHAYLSFVAARAGWRSSAFALTLVAFTAALLSKGLALMLPVALFALDIVPLRRLDVDPRRWLVRAARPVLLEKLPFLALSAIFVGTTYWAASPVFAGVGEAGLQHRLLSAGFGLSFYLEKTLLPIAIPFQVPAIAPLAVATDPLVALRGIVFIAALGSALWVWYRRRRPEVALALLVFTAFVLPVSGLLQAGPQLAAHRYTYLSGISIALLLGGSIHSFSRRWRGRGRIALAGLLLVLAGVLAAAGRAQVSLWRDDVTFCRAAVRAAPMAWGPVGLLASALILGDEPREALAVLRGGRQRMPGAILLPYLEALLLATSPDDELRDGAAALELAEQSVRATSYQDSAALLAFAAAAAESGDTLTATRVLDSALVLSRAGRKPELLPALEEASRQLSERGMIRFSREDRMRLGL